MTRRAADGRAHIGHASKLLGRGKQTGHAGLLLVFPFCSVHLLEASEGTVKAFLRALHAFNAEETQETEGKVLLFQEDIQQPSCSTWRGAFLSSMTGAEAAEPLDSTQAVRRCSSLCTSLQRLGKVVSNLSEDEFSAQATNLDTFYDGVPTAESILSLCATEDFPTIREFLEIYDSPLNVTLSSERTWPVIPGIKV